jgi:hypothetical protein
MLGLFHPLEEYVGPSIITVGILCFVVLLGGMLTFSFEFVGLTFAERGVFTVMWILEFNYLN